jgi:uncharacterized repeat protein (TIGR01451 family)
VRLTLQALVESSANGQTLVNGAAITALDQVDSNLANNSSERSVAIGADLRVSASVSPNSVPQGGQSTFTVVLSNNGPSFASGVQISAPLPAGLTLISATASNGSYNATSGLWSVSSSVTTTSLYTLDLLVQADTDSSQTMTASILNSDISDPDSANNTSSATLNISFSGESAPLRLFSEEGPCGPPDDGAEPVEDCPTLVPEIDELPARQASLTPTTAATAVPEASATMTPSPEISATPDPALSPTATVTASSSPEPSAAASQSAAPDTATPSRTPTATASPTPASTEAATATATPSATAEAA